MRMNRTIKFGILALVAMFALVAIASSVSADPDSIDTPPTEDWFFDSGKIITITGKAWDINYNITVSDGTLLKLDSCQFTINGINSLDYMYTAYIFTDDDSELVMTNSIFIAEEGSLGFYLEAHDDITLTNCQFEGLVKAPGGSGGISVIGDEFTKAQIDFVEVGDTWMCDAIYFENIFVDMSNSDIHDIDGSGVVFMGVETTPDTWYNLSMIDTEIYNCAENGLIVYGIDHYGMLGVNVFNIDIWNVSMDAVDLFLGRKSGSELGTGSMFVIFDQLDVYDIGGRGVYLKSHYTKVGTTNISNIFNATFTNSMISDVRNAGMYVELEYCTVDFYLGLDGVVFTNISVAGPIDSELGGINWIFQQSQGQAILHAENTLFNSVHPSAFEVTDYGGSEFEFVNCEFTRMNQTGAYLRVKSSASQSPTLFENCTFHDADALGISSSLEMSASGTPVRVYNSTFFNLSYAALNADGSTQASGQGFNISGCNIYDIGSYGVLVGGYLIEGRLSLHMTNTTIYRTSGVRVEISQDYVNAGASMDVIIINCTVDGTIGAAITVYGAAYYNPCRMDVQIINTTVTDATGDGITIKSEDTGTKGSGGYYKPKWDATVTIIGTSVSDVGGIGIAMTSVGGAADNQGKRTAAINYTDIRSAQRGLFSYGFKGMMYFCSIQNTLKEDMYVLDGRIDVYYSTFHSITDRKFKTTLDGSIHFHYDMDIIVRWDTGAAALGATVQVFDNKETLIAVLPVTRHDGHLPTFTMEPYYVKETGIFSDTPYVIYTSFLQVHKTIGVKLDASKVVYVILDDHINPEIFILYPKEGHIQQSTTLKVRGSAWDSQSGIKDVMLTLDGETWYEATGSLSWNLTIEVNDTLIAKFSGLFLLRAKAIDNALNEKVTFVMIRVDPTPPELNVDHPYNGFVTNNPELWVRGVTELGSTVEINSVSVEVTISMFTHMVTLVEGPNTISVISIDPLGNIQIERLTVNLDTQEPYIILISPEEDKAMTNEDSITIVATVEEDLYITVNGYHVLYGSDNYPEGAGILTYDLDLEPGENVVVIQARDKADNLKIIDFVVVFDTTPPWIQVISPQNGAVLPRPEIALIGTLDPTATLTIQGESVTVVNGFFEIVVLAFEGENFLNMVAEDAAGNIYTESLTFTVDTLDPVLDITMPVMDDITTNEVRYTIEGTTGYEDLAGSWIVSARTILVNGLPYTEVYDEVTGEILPVLIQVDYQGNFQIPVDLLEGRNEYTIEARDGVGNRVSTTVTIRLDTTAPTLVMYIDPVFIEKDELVSHAYTVNITGYTDPGSWLYINDIPLPVNEIGEFTTAYDLAKGTTEIKLRSMDDADNERSVNQTITFKRINPGEVTDGRDWGLIILIVAIVLLAVVILGMFVYVRGRREDMVEMDAAGATPLAAIDLDEPMEPYVLPGSEDIDLEAGDEDEPAPTTAPARPRPRSPQARRATAPRPVPKGEMPEVEDKDLSEKDAEADIGADETDQEGI